MAARAVKQGPVGRRTRANMRLIRDAQGITLRELDKLTAELGHPLAHGTLSEIENGNRRCDVDDLVTIATALSVEPHALLGIGPNIGEVIHEIVERTVRKRLSEYEQNGID